jgi:multidrug efflux pump
VLPSIEATLPHDVHVGIAVDRSQSVNAAVGDTERTLFIAVLLVIGVVFVFLQSPRAILVPAVALPLSIIGTFGPMYLLGYSIDNLSLMALTIGTGFVVDDAVVVLENIVRHVESGMDVREAALRGSAEVSFTVISMSLSLIAVFLPILLMPGIVGLLFHEFAVTLSIAILISLVISLTVTPTMAAYRAEARKTLHSKARWAVCGTSAVRALQERLFAFADHGARSRAAGRLTLIGLIVLNVFLIKLVPSTFFPGAGQRHPDGPDHRRPEHLVSGDGRRSSRSCRRSCRRIPAVASVIGFTGGRALNTANVFIELKPLAERKLSAAQVVDRLRPSSMACPAPSCFCRRRRICISAAAIGGRIPVHADQRRPQCAVHLGAQAGDRAGQGPRQMSDVNSDLQQNGLQIYVNIDRATAARYGFAPNQIDSVLYDAFGQRTVSTVYNQLNQYYVVMEVAPKVLAVPADARPHAFQHRGGQCERHAADADVARLW